MRASKQTRSKQQLEMDGDPTVSRTRQRQLHQETFVRFATAKMARKCQNIKQEGEEESQKSFVVYRHNDLITKAKNMITNSRGSSGGKQKSYEKFEVENKDFESQIGSTLLLKEDTKSKLTCYDNIYQRVAQQVAAREQIKFGLRKKFEHENENNYGKKSSRLNKQPKITQKCLFTESNQLSSCHNNCKKESTTTNYSGSNNYNDDFSIDNKKRRQKSRNEEGGERHNLGWEKETCRRRLSYNFRDNYVKKAIKSKSNIKCPFFCHRHLHHNHHHHSNSKKIKRLDSLSSISLNTIVIITIFLLLVCSESLSFAYQLANNLIANNLPPKFITSQAGQASNSEIVVRVKEGAASIGKLIFTLKGEDPDDDPLTFGVLGSMASDLLRIENVPGNQANVYLRKELDRETTESYQVVITLTDGKLGRGNWVS